MKGSSHMGHGGNVAAAARLYRVPAGSLIDFSANIVPWGPPASVREAITESFEAIKRYPDPNYGRLRRALGRFLEVPVDCLAVGNGAADLIHQLVRRVRPRTVVVVDPTFSEYGAAARGIGVEVVSVMLDAGRGFRLNAKALLAVVDEGSLVFLCNPNNPTGGLLPRPETLAVAEAIRSQGAFLAVDESFLDFLPDPRSESVAGEAGAGSDLAVIGSLTKFFALPGLRLGYLVADTAFIRAFEDGRAPWTVNAFAEQAGLAAVADHGFASRVRRLVGEEREYLTEGMKGLGWLQPQPSTVNFILARITGSPDRRRWPVLTSSDLTGALARRGVLVRDGRSFAGLGSDHIRVAVRDRADNRRLLAALRSLAHDS
ncbi:MAG: threonine-phosphate decarboxylase CobD [Bacillota bacterium]